MDYLPLFNKVSPYTHPKKFLHPQLKAMREFINHFSDLSNQYFSSNQFSSDYGQC